MFAIQLPEARPTSRISPDESTVVKSFLSEIDLLHGLLATLVIFGHAIDIPIWSSSHSRILKILIRLRKGFGFVRVVGVVV